MVINQGTEHNTTAPLVNMVAFFIRRAAATIRRINATIDNDIVMNTNGVTSVTQFFA